MKNKLSSIIMSLSVLLMTTSCTKVIYTHEQVMKRYNSKTKIVQQFGLPTEKKIGEGIEEWLYDYGTESVRSNYGNSNTNVSISGNANSVYGKSNTNTVSVSSFNQYNKFLKFTFDEEGNAIRVRSQGVDLTERKKQPVKTVLAVILITGGCLGLGALLAGAGG
jgi:hypothetical protein